jgi:hypothetical protein
MAKDPLLPIYTTRGDLGGFIRDNYIFSPIGDWIGWVSEDHHVYSVHGHWVGRWTPERRIVRKREYGTSNAMRTPPPTPGPVRPPGQVPLPPMMPELPTNVIDVLDEMPELLPPIDYGELREDMD